jgi:hypothetical protein
VDRDNSLTLSFFEYCYLAFKMSLGGSYKDMCGDSRDAGFVKRHMLVIGSWFSKLDRDVSGGLTADEMRPFFERLQV